MEIKLNRLTVDNFMGIRHFVFEPNGQSVVILGVNGAGKTTLFSAFLYLLFGKNAEGKADFSLKTLNNGQEVHNLDHMVEGVFDVDGKEISLKKVFREKYTKKRGNANHEFTGHVTDHYIDDVPVKANEWDERISHIIDEDIFKLLTDPKFFNSLHWQKRRALLLEVCGDISDEAVIASDESLTVLPEILDGKKQNDRKELIKTRQSKINDRLKEIPARIDELQRSLTDISGYDVDIMQGVIAELDKEIEAMRDDTHLSKLRKQKAELQAQVSELELEKDKVHRGIFKDREDRLESIEKEIKAKRSNLTNILNELPRKQNAIDYNEKEMARLRTQYNEIEEKGIKHGISNTCPTCGQALPKDQVDAAIKHHNQNQASLLGGINSEGKRLKTENEKLKGDIEALKEKSFAIDKEIKALEAKIKEIEDTPLNNPFDSSKIDKIKAEIAEIEKEITGRPSPDTTGLEGKRSTLQGHIAEVKTSKKTRIRIQELMAEEKALAAEYEKLEGQLSLLDRFIVAKVNLLESKINSKFQLARFKLFEEQINGGISETCIALGGENQVPFGEGLNTGMEINVGLDIIRTLSEHYGIKAPVFIDHAESVTEILDPGTQTIKLMVSEDHPTMEVMYEQ